MNTHIDNSIRGILGNIKFNSKVEPRYKQEGVDHINISLASNHKLGRFLSTRFKTPFVHPEFGSFNSVEGLWQFLTRHIDDEETETFVRTFFGSRNTRHLTKLEKKNVANFKEIIFEVMANKLNFSDEYSKILVKNKLPLQMYYLDTSGNQVVVPFSNWFIGQIDEIVTYLRTKDNEEFEDSEEVYPGEDFQGETSEYDQGEYDKPVERDYESA